MAAVHDVHLVTTEMPPSDLVAALDELGMTKVSVAGTHPNLPSNALFSAYLPNASAAQQLTHDVIAVAQRFDDVGILIEREHVAAEMRFQLPGPDAPLPSFENVAWDGRARSRTKRADIHLSVPAASVSNTLTAAMMLADFTYIDVERTGQEDMLGIHPAPGEVWRAFTVQFAGTAARREATFLYETLAALSAPSEADGVVGTLKLEIASEVWLNPRHPGIPAIEAP